MSGTSDIPAQFVVVYYKNFVYNSVDVKKFYDENAKIWRQSMPSNNGQSLSEAADLLVPEIPKGTDFHVLTYQSCPIDNGFALNVTASLVHSGTTKVLNQSFVLQMKSGRCFVTSDILNINEVSAVLPTNVETTAVKNTLSRNKSNEGKPKGKNKNDKFNYRAPQRK